MMADQEGGGEVLESFVTAHTVDWKLSMAHVYIQCSAAEWNELERGLGRNWLCLLLFPSLGVTSAY